MAKHTKRDLERYVRVLNKHGGNRSAAARELKIPRQRFLEVLEVAADRGLEVPPPMDAKSVAAIRSTTISDDELHDAWSIYERYGYNAVHAAEAAGIERQAMQLRVKKAAHKFGYEKRPLGVTHAAAAKPLNLPGAGEVKRYILTCAQNNTHLHEPTWAALVNLAKYYDAEIKVATFTYIGDDGSAKAGTEREYGRKVEDRWYDPRVVAFRSDEFEQLAPGLVWCGHHNTLPTASDPLRGMDNLNGRSSGIFPHTRIEQRPIATAAGEATKFNWTTGAITLRNYVQKRAGITAEFYHCFGGALAEVDSDGNWWVRQLNADSDGVIYDLDIYADPQGVWQNDDGTEALVYGDIHHESIDPDVEQATWGKGGLVDLLRPKLQIFHDLLNFNPSHHNRRDPHIMYMLQKRGKDVVLEEIRGSGEFLDRCHRDFSREIVVDSNHHRHLDRFLKEVDWRDDLTNARTILKLNEAWLDAIDSGEENDFLAYEWALRHLGFAKHAHFMNMTSRDPAKLSLIVCQGSGGGVEVGAHHGHMGPNGAHGTPRNLSRLGRKNVIADKHAPGIWGGTYVAGLSGNLRQLYNHGPGGWAHAHVPVYKNGKRQVLVGWHTKNGLLFHAPRP